MSKTATLSALIDDTDPQTHAIIANLAGDHVVGYLIKGDGGAPVLNNGQAIVCDPDSAPGPGEMLLVLHPDEAHDGHAGEDGAFAYRMLYLDPAAISQALFLDVATSPA